MGRKNIEIKSEKLMYNPEVEGTRLEGKIEAISLMISNLDAKFTKSIDSLTVALDKQSQSFDGFVTRSEFHEHLKDAEEKIKQVDPVIKWVNDRQAVEKFIYGIIGFIGLSNIILLVKVLFFP